MKLKKYLLLNVALSIKYILRFINIILYGKNKPMIIMFNELPGFKIARYQNIWTSRPFNIFA